MMSFVLTMSFAILLIIIAELPRRFIASNHLNMCKTPQKEIVKNSIDKVLPNHLKFNFILDLDQIQRRKEQEFRKQLQVTKQFPGIWNCTGYIDLTDPKQYTPYEHIFDYQAYLGEMLG
ncbi:MAG: hypothetical protein EZS28_027292 [Streblomastix strix]|uniref:Uncharacterized protein n=1 Tax=Streblomastix strix TaxID=222440 RepID=A0A5J4V502_9EUKA|nr:MAG: hypothetical protein EZS28_027292 [Streblomastix strix]